VDFYARIDEQLGNSILVLYEELVRDPEREIRRIMDFLELPFEEIQTKPTIFGRNVVVVTSSRETRAVFDNTQTTWTQDLTLREKIAIGGYFWLLRCVARFRGRRPATYDDLRRA
jgi:hypothetical protein